MRYVQAVLLLVAVCFLGWRFTDAVIGSAKRLTDHDVGKMNVFVTFFILLVVSCHFLWSLVKFFVYDLPEAKDETLNEKKPEEQK